MSTSFISEHGGWSAFQPARSGRDKVKHFGIEQWQGESPLLQKPGQQNLSFRLVWMTAGQGSCMINFVRYELCRSVICFIPPESTCSIETDTGSAGFVISFSRDFLHLPSDVTDQEFFRDRITALSPVSIIEEEETLGEMEQIARYIQHEYGQYSILRPDILSGWLKIFLVHMKRAARQAGRDGDVSKPMQLLKRFYYLLERNFLSKKMVTEYAAELSVASQYLNATVKRFTGYPASYHIQQRIVLEAKKLAIHSCRSQKEVAYHLGFTDPSHFSKFFKSYAGQSFTEFRYQNRFSA